MSDTPRTDAAELTAGENEDTNDPLYEMADFARTLERELNAALSNLAQCYLLTGADPDGNEDWRLAPYAVSEVARLRAEHDDLEQRITELESQRENWRMSSVCRELQAKCDELEKDKARLDWLEDKPIILAAESPGWSCGSSLNFQNYATGVSTIRAAIDAAMEDKQ